MWIIAKNKGHHQKSHFSKYILPAMLGLIISGLFLFVLLNTPKTAAFNPAEATRIAYWQLEEAAAPYYDSEQALEGDCTGCPAQVVGQIGFGQEFDGIDKSIIVDANNNFNWTTNNSFTIELWLKADANACANGHQYAVARGSSSSGHWAVGCSETTGKARFELSTIADSTLALESTRVITDGHWHHLVAIYDATDGSSTLYLDGTDIVSATTGFTANTDFTSAAADLQMGSLDDGNFFAGVLDEVALYNGRLSEAHIGAHYYLSRPYDNICSPDIRIMPLGDSITRGTTATSPQAGYRKALYDLLTVDELNFDFVGSYSTGGSTFDSHHQAVSGTKAADKAIVVYNRLVNNPADIVLVHLGTNDLKDNDFTPAQTVDHIETLLDEIDRYDEKIAVVLAQIINQRGGEHQPTTDYNALLEPFVAARLANGDKIILVNMETGADIIYDLAANGGDMADDLHLVESGNNKMAVVWYQTLTSFLSICANSSDPGDPTPTPMPAAPTIVSTPVVEAVVHQSYTYQVIATGDDPLTYALDNPPNGMSINSSSGEINWIPSQIGTFPITTSVTNSVGSDTQLFDLMVNEASSNPPNACLLDATAYWKFEESGPPYIDALNGLEATCDASGTCPTQVDGKVGLGQQFSGTSTSGTRVNLPGSVANWASDASFSIAFWAKLNDVGGSNCTTNHGNSQVVIGRDHPDINARWWLGCERDDGRALFQLQDAGGGGPSNIIGGVINDGNWHFVVGVRDGVNNQNHLYVNGNLIGSRTHTYTNDFFVGAQPDQPINVGWINHSNTTIRYHMNGTIDEIAIYDRALTPAEIERHYEAGLVNLGYEYDNWTVDNGNWSENDSWYGNAPGSDDSVAIFNNTNLNQPETAACVDVMANATLDFGSHELTVNGAFSNRGTVKQTKPVNTLSELVEFLHVSGTAGSLYRGAEVTPTTTGLGNVEVTIRAADFDNDDYCTTTEGGSPDYAERCFTITPDTDGAASVRLYAHTDELAGLLVGDLRPYRFIDGTGWNALTTNLATGTEGDFAYAQADAPGFSSFLLGGPINPTAVSLANISTTTGVLPFAPITLLALIFLLLGSGMVYARRRILP